MSNYIVEKIYNPKKIEELIYSFWEKGDYFKPLMHLNKDSYCIVMPPPNITGELHLGHALQQTIMDILIRYQRMQGKNTLWKTGIDHAGIATQILVENKLYSETGKTKDDCGRASFIKKIWKWKVQSEYAIEYQMKRLGYSVDWKSKCFTMDANISYAVQEAFIRLYQANLIYRGKRLVNWDMKLQTAISDLEVESQKVMGTMWYIRYQFDSDQNCYDNFAIHSYCSDENYLVVATTRPETIFGDVAIAVNPKDPRYNKLIGKYVIVPIVNRKIPIIFDQSIEIMKGTGCVKITPAHDFNDYLVGKRNGLPMVNIFSLNGKLLKTPELFDSFGNASYNQPSFSIPQVFQNLEIVSAREKVISVCKTLNLLHKVQPYNLTVSCNSRTGSIIEPMLTNQWYIRVKDLSETAISLVKQNKIKFVPDQYKHMYFSWMDNIQDWCISRQVWWGHKIPVWYDDDNNLVYVGRSELDVRMQNNLSSNVILRADNDVLDTWFSSSLWTFASLGWPKYTNLLNVFHPTNVIVSGFDIIFFWIARMIMLTAYFIKDEYGNSQVPFKIVYVTGLVRDNSGRKMSKSKGNIIDPLDIIDGISIEDLLKKRTDFVLHSNKLNDPILEYTRKQFPNGIQPYGADAVRFTLTALITSSSRDIHWDMQRLLGYHNFCNKLWNASRFVLMHTKNYDCGMDSEKKIFSVADRWIITQLNITIRDVIQQLDHYRFDKVANILHDFIWHQFCDWYIEFAKPIVFHGNIMELRGTRYTLITLLSSILKLAHPVIPFITEKIWQEVKGVIGDVNDETIMLQSFPKYDGSKIDVKSMNDIAWIKNFIEKIRFLRLKMKKNSSIFLVVICKNISSESWQRILNNYNVLLSMARLKKISYIDKKSDIHVQYASIALDEAELLLLDSDICN